VTPMAARRGGQSGSGSGVPPAVFNLPFGRGSTQEIERNLPPSGSKRSDKKFVPAAEAAKIHAHLMTQREHALPEELIGLEIDCSSGRPVLVERTRDGRTPRHVIAPDAPMYLDLRLPDGSEITVEIRMSEPKCIPASLLCHGPADLNDELDDLTAPCSLVDLSDDDELYDAEEIE
jgi:hypothetical protein